MAASDARLHEGGAWRGVIETTDTGLARVDLGVAVEPASLAFSPPLTFGEKSVMTLDPGSDQEPTFDSSVTWKYIKCNCFVSLNEHL